MAGGRNAQLVRILCMIRDLSLSRGGVPVRDLMERYGMARRTVERDLLAIGEAGHLVETLPDEEPGRVRKRIAAGARDVPEVSAGELAAARAAGRALALEAAPAVSSTFGILVDRLEEGQRRPARMDSAALSEAQAFVGGPGPEHGASAAVHAAIQEAILSYRRLLVTYRKGGTAAARDYLAEPYGILFGARNYLVWRGVADRKYRKFSLPFIERAVPTGETFEHDPGFSLEAFAAESFGVMRDEVIDVELLVLPDGRPRLDGFRFHPSQRVEENGDGSATVRFRASGATEICWHLFTWGDRIRVVGPDPLREAHARLLGESRMALDRG